MLSYDQSLLGLQRLEGAKKLLPGFTGAKAEDRWDRRGSAHVLESRILTAQDG